MAIFIFNKEEGKMVEVKEVPISIDDTRNYVNMRKTWSGQTKVEFNQTTMDEDIAQRNKRNAR
tara:strand:+ start:617 stop:805 length:189 start_codon:yes stop_codon:yes gene_type:complete